MRESPGYFIRDGNQVWMRGPIGGALHWVKPHCSVDDLLHEHEDDKYEYRRSRLAPGEHNPRIWQVITGRSRPPVSEMSISSSVAAVSSLAIHFSEICRFVEPEPRNAGTFGHEMRQLLMLCCMEVEAGLRCVLRENGYSRAERTWNRKDYQKLMAPMHLDQWEMKLAMHPGYPSIRPFDGWTGESGLPWYTAYNNVKHDREGCFSEATLENTALALAGAFIVVMAQFGPEALGFEQQFFARAYISEHPHFRMFVLSKTPHWAASELVVPPLDGKTWTPVPYFG